MQGKTMQSVEFIEEYNALCKKYKLQLMLTPAPLSESLVAEEETENAEAVPAQ